MTTLGFTLIELLAVIVILAIIALIATPIVLDIIEDTKKSATLRSAENYIKAAEMAVAKEMMYNAAFKANVCDITEEGNLDCNGTSIGVAVSGEKPDDGELTFGSGSVTKVTLIYGDNTITRQDGTLVYGVQLESGLYDVEGKLIATWDELVNNYRMDIEKDYEAELSEKNPENIPGITLTEDDKLKNGVKLVIDSSVTKLGY